jgi:tRNA-dihydrouridine synthase
MVDKAMSNVERVVDRACVDFLLRYNPLYGFFQAVPGTVCYNGKHEHATFTGYPIEKPYLIFQVGSADPDLALQVARLVVDDVSASSSTVTA